MNLLDRHIFKSVLFTSLGAVALFASVLILGNVIKELLGYLLAGQLPLNTFVWLLALLVPYVVTYALPMGVLTAVLLTLGRFSADSEITAMRAAGLSLPRIARPIFILAVVGTASALYVNFEAMPWSRVEYERRFTEAVRRNPLSFIVPKTFIRDFSGYVIYIGETQQASMRDFWLWQLDREGRVTHFVRAESGHFDYDGATHEFILTVNNAQVETRDSDNPEDFSEPPLVATFESLESARLALGRLSGGRTARQKLQWQTLPQLLAESARLGAQSVPPDEAAEHARAHMKVRLVISDKINTGLAVLSFVLIGVPLGIKVSRRETSASLGLAVVLALSYYFLTVMVGWLDRRPELRPDLLLWLPNLLFIALGLWLFQRIDRR